MGFTALGSARLYWLAALLAFSTVFASAEGNPVNISDAALRYCVEQTLDKAPGTSITEGEMATISELHCARARRNPHGAVSSLAGLQFATRLSLLSLSANAVADLRPLAKLTSLTTLYLSNNRISDLAPLARLTSLTTLMLNSNAIWNLAPLAKLTALTHLELGDNAVADLSSLSALDSLTHLSLVGNPVSDLSPLAGLTALTGLFLERNAISDVSPLGRLTSLTQLSLHTNAVADISALAKLTSLRYLELGGNAISNVSALDGLNALGQLYMVNNRIADIVPLTRNAGLGDGDVVSLNDNPIGCGVGSPVAQELRNRGVSVYADPATPPMAPTGFEARPSDGSARLSWWRSPAEDCHVMRYEVRHGTGEPPNFGPWREHANVTRPNYSVEGLINGLRYTFEVRAVGIGGAGAAAQVHTLPAEGPDTPVQFDDLQLSAGIAAALGKTAASGTGDVTITQGDMATLRDLDLRAMDIKNLAGLAYASNLRSLLLRGNRVQRLAPIVGLEFLSALDLSANGLTDISSLAHMPALERLWLNDNRIADITPLVANAGLGEGAARPHGSSDYVDLRGNPLNAEALADHAPALRERGATVLLDDGAHRLPLFAPASDSWRTSFARIINLSAESGDVEVTAIDASGRRHAPATLPIGAREAIHFNSNDLENGNVAKGLVHGVGTGIGTWRLEVRSSLPLEVFAHMRHADGVVTSMTALAPEHYAQHRVSMFNPGSNSNQASRLRIINRAGKVARVLLEALDDHGHSASVALTVPARATREFTAAALEEGGGAESGIAEGGLGDGNGKWRLTATSYDDVQVQNILASPSGHRMNLSAAHRGGVREVHHLPLLPDVASLSGGVGFVRVVNYSARGGSVHVSAVDADGRSQAAGTLTLRPFGAVHFNRHHLEDGNLAKGLSGLTGMSGTLRLELHTALDVGVYGYARMADGLLASIHELAPVTETGAHRVVFFNPARNLRQASRLRLINISDTAADVTIRGMDDTGNAANALVRLTIPARGTRELTAHDLETGGMAEAEGAFGEGAGRWRLWVESDSELAVMSLVDHATGHLTNLSR